MNPAERVQVNSLSDIDSLQLPHKCRLIENLLSEAVRVRGIFVLFFGSKTKKLKKIIILIIFNLKVRYFFSYKIL